MTEKIGDLNLSEELFELRAKFLHKLSLKNISPKVEATEVWDLAKIYDNEVVFSQLKNKYLPRNRVQSFLGFTNTSILPL